MNALHSSQMTSEKIMQLSNEVQECMLSIKNLQMETVQIKEEHLVRLTEQQAMCIDSIAEISAKFQQQTGSTQVMEFEFEKIKQQMKQL